MSDQTINIRPPLWLPIVAVAIGGAFYIAGKNMEIHHATPPGTIVVSGEGKADVTPNIAEVDFGMDTGIQSTTAGAMTKLTTAMNNVYAALQKAGVNKKDIATQNFSLNPSYDWTSGTQTLKGYQAVESLHVKVRNMDTVSAVVTAATTAGANQAGGVNFTVDNPDATQADARAKAIANAKAKAQTLADQLGVSLGAVQSFTESSGGQPPIMYDKAMSAGMGGGGPVANVPLPSGTQEVTVDVSITYEIQ